MDVHLKIRNIIFVSTKDGLEFTIVAQKFMFGVGSIHAPIVMKIPENYFFVIDKTC